MECSIRVYISPLLMQAVAFPKKCTHDGIHFDDPLSPSVLNLNDDEKQIGQSLKECLDASIVTKMKQSDLIANYGTTPFPNFKAVNIDTMEEFTEKFNGLMIITKEDKKCKLSYYFGEDVFKSEIPYPPKFEEFGDRFKQLALQ
jgi:hypothetical protein